MRVTMVTDAGHAGRSNEDFAGAVACGLVLVDGAGGIAGAQQVCHHGVTWYATRLGGAILGALSQDRSLRDVLAESIERITDEHRDSCDVAHSISPYAAVAMLRFSGGLVEYLLLGDAVVLVGRSGVERAAPGGRGDRDGTAQQRSEPARGHIRCYWLGGAATSCWRPTDPARSSAGSGTRRPASASPPMTRRSSAAVKSAASATGDGRARPRRLGEPTGCLKGC